jgi:hypothetical protein
LTGEITFTKTEVANELNLSFTPLANGHHRNVDAELTLENLEQSIWRGTWLKDCFRRPAAG